MKIILCDTNIVFPLFARIIKGEEISHSSVFEMSHKHEVYISTTVLEELDENLFENFGLTLTKEHITSFIEKSQIKISPSHELQQSYTSYVNDFDDAQILQDAVDIHAQFLISRNISDFNIWKIQEDFDIKILGYIPEELL